MADSDVVAVVVGVIAVAFVVGAIFGVHLTVYFYRRARARRLAELG